MADSLLNSMNISSSGMSAQRTRMDIIAENIANAEATRTSAGGPYRRRQVIFQAIPQQQAFSNVFSSQFSGQASGNQLQSVEVQKVVQDPTPFREVYDPSHPDADSRGIVKLPNVNSVEEMVDMNSAARSFEANVTTMEASKRMFLKTLELLK